MLSLCVCEIIVVVCVREAAGGDGARDTESKTRTPHKVVGKKNPHLSKDFNWLQLKSSYFFLPMKLWYL